MQWDSCGASHDSVRLLSRRRLRAVADCRALNVPSGGRLGTEVVVVKVRNGAFRMFPALLKHSVPT
jgi:hypothetical protein